MASVASQLIEEVTAHAQSDGLEDAREIWADGTQFPNNLRTTLLPTQNCVQGLVFLIVILRSRISLSQYTEYGSLTYSYCSW